MNLFQKSFESFLSLTIQHPYMMGFLKFFFFASLGELVSTRINLKKWNIPKGFFYKASLWGFLGVLITFSFEFYSEGVRGLLNKGVLPGLGIPIAFAFFTSFLNNLTFAPCMMSFHKFFHSHIEENLKKRTSLLETFERVSWKEFFLLTCFKKIPLFWIPIHTLTFLLPEVYRVLFASFLSFLLGVFLTANHKKEKLLRSV